MLANIQANIIAVHFWHIDVEQHKLYRIIEQIFQSFGTRFTTENIVTHFSENVRVLLQLNIVIIDDKNLFLYHFVSLSS